jgi:hypothetical protein
MANQKYKANDIYEAIVLYKFQHGGNSPSYQTLVNLIGASSKSAIKYVVDDLQFCGWIAIDDDGTLRVTGEAWSYVPPPGAPVVIEAMRDIPQANPLEGET